MRTLKEMNRMPTVWCDEQVELEFRGEIEDALPEEV